MPEFKITVIDEATSQSTKRANNARQVAGYPANAGIQFLGLIGFQSNQMNNLDSRLRGNDGVLFSR